MSDHHAALIIAQTFRNAEPQHKILASAYIELRYFVRKALEEFDEGSVTVLDRFQVLRELLKKPE